MFHSSGKITASIICFTLLYSTAHAVTVQVEDAWVREAPPGSTTLAAYMRIHNPATRDLTILEITSPSFKKIEIHQTTIVNNMMRMEKVERATIPAHSELVLEPGGKHLMLFSSESRLKAGDHVTIILSFKKDQHQEIQAEVKKADSMNQHQSNNHHH